MEWKDTVYGSATTVAGTTAWGAYLPGGSVNSGTKTYDHFVWPVRGGQ